MQRQMAPAGMAVVDAGIHPVRPVVDVFHLFRPTTGAVEYGHIGAKDGIEPPRTALLNGDRLTRYRVSRVTWSPPSLTLQHRLQLLPEPAIGFSFIDSLLQCPANIFQDIQAGHFSNGKGAGMGLLPHFFPVPGNLIPFGLQVADCPLRGKRHAVRQFSRCYAHADAPGYLPQRECGPAAPADRPCSSEDRAPPVRPAAQSG